MGRFVSTFFHAMILILLVKTDICNPAVKARFFELEKLFNYTDFDGYLERWEKEGSLKEAKEVFESFTENLTLSIGKLIVVSGPLYWRNEDRDEESDRLCVLLAFKSTDFLSSLGNGHVWGNFDAFANLGYSQPTVQIKIFYNGSVYWIKTFIGFIEILKN